MLQYSQTPIKVLKLSIVIMLWPSLSLKYLLAGLSTGTSAYELSLKYA